MTAIKMKYLGNLQVESEHGSGAKIVTNASKDADGNGVAFSPTELCATALGSCILTAMAMYAEKHGVKFENAEAEVTEKMENGPRRIGQVDVLIKVRDEGYSEKEKKILERVTTACPVHHSLSENMVQNVVLKWVK